MQPVRKGRKPTLISIDCSHEDDRVPFVRALDALVASQTRSAADTLLLALHKQEEPLHAELVRKGATLEQKARKGERI